jgi:hypothetical protein
MFELLRRAWATVVWFLTPPEASGEETPLNASDYVALNAGNDRNTGSSPSQPNDSNPST